MSAAAPAATPLVHIYTQNVRAQLPAGTHPCAGALPTAQRLSAPNVDTVFVASDTQLSLLQPIAPANPVIRPGRQGPFASDFIPLTSRLTTLDGHRAVSELQCVASRSCGDLAQRNYLVGSVDSYGTAVVSRVHVPHSGIDGDSSVASAATPLSVVSSAQLRPPTSVEDGWHGICLHPLLDEQACVASYYGKSLSLYSGSQLLQTLYTAAAPTAVQFMHSPHFNAPLLLCTEGNVLSVWDVRTSNGVGQSDNVSRGAVQRLQDTPGQLFALDSHADAGLLATGGVDKQVSVYDARRWGVSGRWKNVLKYEIMSLCFSAFSSDCIYVAGLDHEVYAGRWSAHQQQLNQRNLERAAFRGDARWVGLARTSDPPERRGGDQLVGITESAQVYILRNAHLQSGPVAAAPPQGTAAASASSSGAGAASVPQTDAQRKRDIAQARKERVAAGLPALTEEEAAKRAQISKNKADKKRKADSAGLPAEAGDPQPQAGAL